MHKHQLNVQPWGLCEQPCSPLLGMGMVAGQGIWNCCLCV